jgi:putative alpha-1,2-mannosidase
MEDTRTAAAVDIRKDPFGMVATRPDEEDEDEEDEFELEEGAVAVARTHASGPVLSAGSFH